MAEPVRFILELDDRGSPQLRRFRSELGHTRTEAATTTRGLGSLQSRILAVSTAVIATTLSIGALTRAFRSTITAIAGDADRFIIASRAFDLPIESLSRLDFVAQQAGVSLEALLTGMRGFASQIVTALQTPTNETIKIFRDLGFSTEEVRGLQQDLIGSTFKVAAAINDMTDTTQRAGFATRLFGRGFQSIFAALEEAGGDIDRFTARVERLGGVMTTDLAFAVKSVGDAMTDVQFATRGLVMRLIRNTGAADALAARFRSMAERIADLDKDLDPDLVQSLEAAVGAFRDFGAALIDVGKEIKSAVGDADILATAFNTIALALSTYTVSIRAAAAALAWLNLQRAKVAGPPPPPLVGPGFAQSPFATTPRTTADEEAQADAQLRHAQALQAFNDAADRTQELLRRLLGQADPYERVADNASDAATETTKVGAAIADATAKTPALSDAAQKFLVGLRNEVELTEAELRGLDRDFLAIIQRGEQVGAPAETVRALATRLREASDAVQAMVQETENAERAADELRAIRDEIDRLTGAATESDQEMAALIDRLVDLGQQREVVTPLVEELFALRDAARDAQVGVIDLFDAFSEAGQTAFDALARGTLEFEDILESLQFSIVRSFSKAFFETLREKAGFEAKLKINFVDLIGQIQGIFGRALPQGISGLLRGDGATAGTGATALDPRGLLQTGGGAVRQLLGGASTPALAPTQFVPIFNAAGDTVALITPTGQAIGAGFSGTLGAAGVGITSGFTPVIGPTGSTVALFTPAGNLVTSAGLVGVSPTAGAAATSTGAAGGSAGLSALGSLSLLGALASLGFTIRDFARSQDRARAVTAGQREPADIFRATSAVGLAGGAAGGAVAGALVGAPFVGIGAVPGAIIGAAIGAAISQAISSSIQGAIGGGVSEAARRGLSQRQLERNIRQDPGVQISRGVLGGGFSPGAQLLGLPRAGRIASGVLFPPLLISEGLTEAFDALLGAMIPDVERLFDELFVEAFSGVGVSLNRQLGSFLGEGLGPRGRHRLRELFFSGDDARALHEDLRNTTALVAGLIGAGISDFDRLGRFTRIFANSLAQAGKDAGDVERIIGLMVRRISGGSLTRAVGRVRGLFGPTADELTARQRPITRRSQRAEAVLGTVTRGFAQAGLFTETELGGFIPDIQRRERELRQLGGPRVRGVRPSRRLIKDAVAEFLQSGDATSGLAQFFDAIRTGMAEAITGGLARALTLQGGLETVLAPFFKRLRRAQRSGDFSALPEIVEQGAAAVSTDLTQRLPALVRTMTTVVALQERIATTTAQAQIEAGRTLGDFRLAFEGAQALLQFDIPTEDLTALVGTLHDTFGVEFVRAATALAESGDIAGVNFLVAAGEIEAAADALLAQSPLADHLERLRAFTAQVDSLVDTIIQVQGERTGVPPTRIRRELVGERELIPPGSVHDIVSSLATGIISVLIPGNLPEQFGGLSTAEFFDELARLPAGLPPDATAEQFLVQTFAFLRPEQALAALEEFGTVRLAELEAEIAAVQRLQAIVRDIGDAARAIGDRIATLRGGVGIEAPVARLERNVPTARDLFGDVVREVIRRQERIDRFPGIYDQPDVLLGAPLLDDTSRRRVYFLPDPTAADFDAEALAELSQLLPGILADIETIFEARKAALEGELQLAQDAEQFFRGARDAFRDVVDQIDILRRGPRAQADLVQRQRARIEALLPTALTGDREAITQVQTLLPAFLTTITAAFGPGSAMSRSLLDFAESVASQLQLDTGERADQAQTEIDRLTLALDEWLAVFRGDVDTAFPTADEMRDLLAFVDLAATAITRIADLGEGPEGFAAQLTALDDTLTTFLTDFRNAIDRADHLAQELFGIQRSIGLSNIRNALIGPGVNIKATLDLVVERLDALTPRQHGGPLRARQAALVGEVGPEVFVTSRAAAQERPSFNPTVVADRAFMSATDRIARDTTTTSQQLLAATQIPQERLAGRDGGPALIALPDGRLAAIAGQDSPQIFGAPAEIAAHRPGTVSDGHPLVTLADGRQAAVIGQDGPEIFVPPVSGDVISHEQSARLLTHRQFGGSASERHPLLVGEAGPELFVPRTREATQAQPITVEIQVGPIIIQPSAGDRLDPADVARAVAEALRLQVEPQLISELRRLER